MVKKTFGYQAQVLAVLFVLLSTHLKEIIAKKRFVMDLSTFGLYEEIVNFLIYVPTNGQKKVLCRNTP